MTQCALKHILQTLQQNQFSINKHQINLPVEPLPVHSRGSHLLIVFIAEAYSTFDFLCFLCYNHTNQNAIVLEMKVLCIL